MTEDEPELQCCPITAVYENVGTSPPCHFIGPGEYPAAADFLGLEDTLAHDIAAAADRAEHTMPRRIRLRARILSCLLVLLAACDGSAPDPEPQPVPTFRELAEPECGVCYEQAVERQVGPNSWILEPGELVWEPCADQESPETCGGFGAPVCDGEREGFGRFIMTRGECFDESRMAPGGEDAST